MGRGGRLGPCLEGAVQWQATHVIRFQSWALEVSKLKVTAPGASPPTHLFPLSQASECLLSQKESALNGSPICKSDQSTAVPARSSLLAPPQKRFPKSLAGSEPRPNTTALSNLFSLGPGCLVDTRSTTLLPEELIHCPLFSRESRCETRLSEEMRLRPSCYSLLCGPRRVISPHQQRRNRPGSLLVAFCFLPVPAQGQ